MGPRYGLLAREPAPPRPQTRAGRKIDLYATCAVDGSAARVGTCGLYDPTEAVASGTQATDQSLEGDGRTRVNLINGVKRGALDSVRTGGNRAIRAHRPSRSI